MEFGIRNLEFGSEGSGKAEWGVQIAEVCKWKTETVSPTMVDARMDLRS